MTSWVRAVRRADAANHRAPLKAEEMGGEKAQESSRALFLPHLLQSCWSGSSNPVPIRQAETEKTLWQLTQNQQGTRSETEMRLPSSFWDNLWSTQPAF